MKKVLCLFTCLTLAVALGFIVANPPALTHLKTTFLTADGADPMPLCRCKDKASCPCPTPPGMLQIQEAGIGVVYGYGLLILIVLGGTFYAGARYGRQAEAQAIAIELRLQAKLKAEYNAVLDDIRKFENVFLARLKKFL